MKTPSDEERELDQMLERIRKAREAIVAHLGPWKKQPIQPSIWGYIACPNCQATLYYRRAGVNGHISARCITKGCVPSWME